MFSLSQILYYYTLPTFLQLNPRFTSAHYFWWPKTASYITLPAPPPYTTYHICGGNNGFLHYAQEGRKEASCCYIFLFRCMLNLLLRYRRTRDCKIFLIIEVYSKKLLWCLMSREYYWGGYIQREHLERQVQLQELQDRGWSENCFLVLAKTLLSFKKKNIDMKKQLRLLILSNKYQLLCAIVMKLFYRLTDNKITLLHESCYFFIFIV